MRFDLSCEVAAATAFLDSGNVVVAFWAMSIGLSIGLIGFLVGSVSLVGVCELTTLG